MNIKLYYFEFVDNNRGRWDKSWHESEEAAEDARKQKIEYFGNDAQTDSEEQDGRYGNVGEVDVTEVTPTFEGILSFARDFAVED